MVRFHYGRLFVIPQRLPGGSRLAIAYQAGRGQGKLLEAGGAWGGHSSDHLPQRVSNPTDDALQGSF